jgi:GNAT superfamily N-acetyltransferase
MAISEDVVVVSLDECSESARAFVRRRLALSLERMVPSREEYVRITAARDASGLLMKHGVVRACVDAESRDVVLGCVAAFGATIAVLAVREKYRGLGVGDALVDAVGVHSSLRALPDVTQKIDVMWRADVLWSWCMDWSEARS